MEARRILLVENGNEISFVIHNKIEILKQNTAYHKLKDLGFIEEPCLANTSFIEKYVDQ